MKALIIAVGRGSRLNKLTKDIPIWIYVDTKEDIEKAEELLI